MNVWNSKPHLIRSCSSLSLLTRSRCSSLRASRAALASLTWEILSCSRSKFTIIWEITYKEIKHDCHPLLCSSLYYKTWPNPLRFMFQNSPRLSSCSWMYLRSCACMAVMFIKRVCTDESLAMGLPRLWLLFMRFTNISSWVLRVDTNSSTSSVSPFW